MICNSPFNLFLHQKNVTFEISVDKSTGSPKDLSGNLLTVLTDAQLQGPKSVRNLQFDRNFLTW
ncbi:unnamed protein product [Brugia pahangi]|uniref:Cadherin domain-containing protein n=1 Tax=Brugia pahangi TaxID=6280 RepID=A0A0N4TMJ0_BRUPA|nr:unnamed protein product [Brugia pahangi]